MWVSKADGSQTVDPQRDAVLAAGVDAAHLYEPRSGRSDERLGLFGVAARVPAIGPTRGDVFGQIHVGVRADSSARYG